MPKNPKIPSPKTPVKLPRYIPYQPKLGLIICYYVASGARLIDAAAAAGLTSDYPIYQWQIDEPDFAKAYQAARDIRAHRMFDQLIELADTATNENYNAVRLQVDTRKWAIVKMLPNVYGDKLTAELSVHMSLEQLVLQSIKLQNDPGDRVSDGSEGKRRRANHHMVIEHEPAESEE